MQYRSQIKKAQTGFTLIELMIVVAIIGILAAIAIPQYQTYVAKSQVARVISETGSQKTAVEDCVLNGKLTASATVCGGTATGSSLMDPAGANTVNGGPPEDTKMGAPVLAFQDAGAATLTAKFGSNAAAVLKDKTVVWTRDKEGTWTCKSDVAKKYEQIACPTSSAS